jgi:hypothetical protein
MRRRIYIVFGALLMSQTLLLLKTFEFGNGDFTGYIVETVILIFLVGFFLARYTWAKRSLITFIGLLFVVSAIGGIQHADSIFYLIALLQAFALYQIFTLIKSAKA